MISHTEENYLKALLNLANDVGEVNVKELSKCLKIKMPTVTSMMKKLALKKLVNYESYKPLSLTDKGKKEAALIIRKHRLIEMFLVNKMGFGWEEVHEIAEQIEHIYSPVFFERIDSILNYPKIDPHGSVIPDKNGKFLLKKYSNLSNCTVGETIKVSAVINSSFEFLKFLNSKSIQLGTVLKIKTIQSFDKSFIVVYNKSQTEMLSHIICERLLVEKMA